MTREIRWFAIAAAMMVGIALLMESPAAPPMLGQDLGGGGRGLRAKPCALSQDCVISNEPVDVDLTCQDPTWCIWYWPFSHTQFEEVYYSMHCEVYRTCGTVTLVVREYDRDVRTSKKKVSCC